MQQPKDGGHLGINWHYFEQFLTFFVAFNSIWFPHLKTNDKIFVFLFVQGEKPFYGSSWFFLLVQSSTLISSPVTAPALGPAIVSTLRITLDRFSASLKKWLSRAIGLVKLTRITPPLSSHRQCHLSKLKGIPPPQCADKWTTALELSLTLHKTLFISL